LAKSEKTVAHKGQIETGSGAPRNAERTLEEAIGGQIRMHRKRLDMTGAELGSSARLSTGMLSKIENGQISVDAAVFGAGAQSAALVLLHAVRGAS
jgi:DNA-binding XRE family transcriptional regulator